VLTAKEIARHFGVSNSTARGRLLRGRIAGAELRQSELGQPHWVAPEGPLKDFTPPRPGPVLKVDKAAPGSNGKVVVKKAAKTAKRK